MSLSISPTFYYPLGSLPNHHNQQRMMKLCTNQIIMMRHRYTGTIPPQLLYGFLMQRRFRTPNTMLRHTRTPHKSTGMALLFWICSMQMCLQSIGGIIYIIHLHPGKNGSWPHSCSTQTSVCLLLTNFFHSSL